MNIAETIYQHVKIMPIDKALEVLQFIAVIETKETKNNKLETKQPDNEMLEFMQNLPVLKKRSDQEINQAFQSMRDEWV